MPDLLDDVTAAAGLTVFGAAAVAGEIDTRTALPDWSPDYDVVPRVTALRTELRAVGLDHVVLVAGDLAGNLGGDLAGARAAEAITRTLGMPLTVLSGTDPQGVAAAVADRLQRTVVVLTSTSPTSTPLATDSHRRAYLQAFEDHGIHDLGRRFVFVTVPGSPLATTALEMGAQLFLAQPGALSAFSLVPAGLAGADIGDLVEQAFALAEPPRRAAGPAGFALPPAGFAPAVSLPAAAPRAGFSAGFSAGSAAGSSAGSHAGQLGHPAVALGSALAAAVDAGRNKFALAPDGSGIVGLGEWVAALLAASGPATSGPAGSGPAASGPAASGPAGSAPTASGPAGSGFTTPGPPGSRVPGSGPATTGGAGSRAVAVVLETPSSWGHEGPDVLSVTIGGALVPGIMPGGGIAPDLAVNGPLGAQLLAWEQALTVAGLIAPAGPPGAGPAGTGRPSSQEGVLRVLDTGLPPQVPRFVDGAVEVHGAVTATTLIGALDEFAQAVPPGAILAVHAYLDRIGDAAALSVRTGLAGRVNRAVTFAWGGGAVQPAAGVGGAAGTPAEMTIQITGAVTADLRVPGRPYTFGELQAAEAADDRQALLDRGRPLLRLHLTDRTSGIDQLLAALGG
ncbi:hypothetical protein ACFO1B_37100 [Dactylosporangium siamense]|uniref:hypothetical protein n=1 Tax=Dactylosporangium siamense TaxID=685454 RepID=UPI0019450F19|nr:hypothetical protein [Dactylosporangium siamense]